MFASLIADEATPMPVSIGLFGEWGAGKSTFMGLLRGEIEGLCGQPGYVHDVVQIGFDAWHYADANLWANIGDEIFHALTWELTPPEDRPESVKKRAAKLRKEITDGLVTARELDARIEQAGRQSEQLAAEVRKEQEKQVTARKLLGAALKSPQLDKAWRRLGIGDQVAQGEMLAGEIDGVKGGPAGGLLVLAGGAPAVSVAGGPARHLRGRGHPRQLGAPTAGQRRPQHHRPRVRLRARTGATGPRGPGRAALRRRAGGRGKGPEDQGGT